MAKQTKPKLPPEVLEFFREQGRKGGLKLKRERGKAYYRRVGKMGGRPRSSGVTLEGLRARLSAGLKWCWACRKWKRLAYFGKDKSRHDGQNMRCFICLRAAQHRFYKPKPRRSQLGERYVAARDGDVKQARARVNHAVQIGRFPRPNSLPCADCGHVWKPGERRHEYDHHLGYGAEHHQSVEAVCVTCHARRGRQRGEIIHLRNSKGRFTHGRKN